MRDPNRLNEATLSDPNVIILENIPKYDIVDWDLNDEKEMRKYILLVKRLIRNSFEYKQMVKYLKEEVGMNTCIFFPNLSCADNKRIKIHIHHEPLTIEDIIGIVIRKRMFFFEDMDEEETAKEVMMLHYKMMVGLVPLSETAHTAVHNRFLFVPMNIVFGNVDAFLSLYDQFILPEQKEYIDNIKEATETYDHQRNLDILQKKYIYIDQGENNNLLENYAKVRQVLDRKVEQIESGNPNLQIIYYRLDRN